MTIEQPDWTPPRPFKERTTQDRVIVGAGFGLRAYAQRLRSTINHCEVYSPGTWKLWYDVLPEGCPPHEESQYAFKIFALRRAIVAPFRYVLWMDSSFQPIGDMEPLWKHIEEHGFYVPIQGDAKLGAWTSDAALSLFGMSRDDAMGVPLVYSGLVGLDLESRVGKLIWNLWLNTYESGTWDGPHFNELPHRRNGAKWYGMCSLDPRCEGHRHDEAALSFVLHSLGLRPVFNDFLTLHSEKGFIGHMVHDYDIVAMREEALNQINSDWSRGSNAMNDADEKRIRAICR